MNPEARGDDAKFAAATGPRALQPSAAPDAYTASHPLQPPAPASGTPEPPGGAPQDAVGFARLVGAVTAIRLAVDTSVQIFNPFLGLIAAGLGSNVIVLGRLVSLRSAMGLFAPAFGALTSRWGYRRTIRLALFLVATGMLLIGASPNVWVAALGMIVMGLGTGCFTPLLHAYLSGRLPYSRRARAFGIVEYSWALTGIVGLLLVGLLIEATSWRVPFFLLSGLLAVSGLFVMRLPPTQHTYTPAAAQPAARSGQACKTGLRDYFRLPGNVASTWGTIAVGGLNYFAAMQFMIIYGAWLMQDFGLGAAALGRVAFVFGWFDLTASIAVSLFTDRLGKRRAVLLGSLVAIAGYLAVAGLRLPMFGVIALLGFARLGFEFAIVSYFPLLSEQQPAQRSKTLTMGAAFGLFFATASGFTAPWLFTHYGMQGVALLSAVVSSAAVGVLIFVVREGGAVTEETVGAEFEG